MENTETALSDFLTVNRDEIIARTQLHAEKRMAPRPGETVLRHGIPLFLTQLVAALQAAGNSTAEIGASATLNGKDLLRMGLTVAQVIHCYGDFCQSVTELADQQKDQISASDFHTFNRCLDDAMAHAVTEYASQREQRIADQTAEQLDFHAHELRNLLNTAILAYEVLKSGSVGITSSTGGVLDRSLRSMANLIVRSIAEVRLRSGSKTLQRVELAEFVEEIEVAAILEASARGIAFSVSPAEYGVAVQADRQSLTAAVTNLLHNAFKFTRPKGQVSLKLHATENRVLIEVEDECGGLPPGQTEELFRPFEQRGADRTGLGLGLAISRQAVEASGGELRVRDLPGRGCVFTIDLPRQDHDKVGITKQ